ncbi:MAG: hypothetical protein ACOCUL_02740 [Bacteroidota bacterium]
MKILYIISIKKHGNGGHLYSLMNISSEIAKKNEVNIISIGPGNTSIIKTHPLFLKHIEFNGLNFFSLRQQLIDIGKYLNPDIYHCFDESSYNIIRLIFSSRKNIIVLNKCGGPNPSKYSHIKNLILFSQENLEWFQKQNKFKNTNIHLIPNRVKPLKIKAEFKPIEKNKGDFIFMRICRIGHTYKKSIQDSINLISKLMESDLRNVKLYVIGVVEVDDIFYEFKKHELVKSGHLTILTESKYTNEASKMLYLADTVIGTGRGLMEAASLGKPVLAIDKNGNIPVLLNDKHFNDAFKTNFSERNVFPRLDDDENIKSIIQIINNNESYLANCSFVKQSFDKYFSLEKATEAYPTAYKVYETGKRKLIADLPLILSNILNFYRSYLKLIK